MSERAIALTKMLAQGMCSCYRLNASCSISVVPTHPGAPAASAVSHYDPGLLVRCLRCRAREALDADNVNYTKDDVSITLIH